MAPAKELAWDFEHPLGSWQVSPDYAKSLSHDLHPFVNEVFRGWVEEKADSGLKIERAVSAFERRGKSPEWIAQRFKGINARNALTGTMRDHNCKVNGPRDNPYAEATRSITMAVTGSTPREIKEAKGLPSSAPTRDHMEEHELAAIMWAEACPAS
jgi:hypothetical protein